MMNTLGWSCKGKMMKLSSALCLFLILIVEEASCSMRLHKLSEFHAKLQQRVAYSPEEDLAAPVATPGPDGAKRMGRVFYPVGYGGDPTGKQESSEAIVSALSDAFRVQSDEQMLPGVTALGGVVIDLQGGTYLVAKPIRLPASGGGNVVVQGGTLRASETFPGDRHLVELWSPNSPGANDQSTCYPMKVENVGIYYEDITFRDVLFDSSFRGGGIYVVDSARIRITDCFFLHFTTDGILVKKGHETFISGCFLGQHSTVGGDKRERSFTGTAIDLQSNDNAITDVVIFSAAVGIVLRGQANMVTGVHCYNKATYFGGIGILVKLAGLSQTRLDNCYMDYTGIVMEDPVQVHVTNGFFLGDANIVLKSIKGQVSGLNVVNNMFDGDPQRLNPIVVLDGQFPNVDEVVVDGNNVNGMSLRTTVGKMTLKGNGTKWVADFSSTLLFPNRINHFQYSFYAQGEMGFIKHEITNVSNNAVVVESEKAANAVVSVVVDQYSMAGEVI
ncbi:polygalacturonase QRT3 [Rhodamnia argentea]|uniref:Polygalacturonase QRT3 n=1 Tax=Rhodamnia argentea TaxID=178133 RepID=A0A8B8QUD0_9MYRT|nr:polygalacturonase QRT3 [Rhodamnia argentea]